LSRVVALAPFLKRLEVYICRAQGLLKMHPGISKVPCREWLYLSGSPSGFMLGAVCSHEHWNLWDCSIDLCPAFHVVEGNHDFG